MNEDCERVYTRLSEYLDAELPPDLCGQIEQHLTECTACAGNLEGLRRTVAICRKYQGSEAPGPVKAELREELLAAYRTVLSRRTW